jgi:lipoate-protein ligase A
VGSWNIKRPEGSVADRHLTFPTFESRQIIIHEIDKPTMVFGTAQKDMSLEVAIECDYVYRKSGGGAVFLEPGKVLWVDFVVPREDPLWCNDIRHSSVWLGELWVRAMKNIGLNGKVHNEEIRKTELSRLVCFAGLATGEVTVSGKKAVGISQRRTREGAWFQCAALFSWPAERIAQLLQMEPTKKVVDDLLELAAPIRADPDELLLSLIKSLN